MARVAVVTGGASGMGRSICEHLARRGDRVAVLDLNGVAAARVAEELGTDGHPAVACEVDVTDRPAVDDAMRKVRKELGPVEILVTSAGMAAFEAFADITIESWNRIIDVNLTGTFHCVQAVITDMVVARWGRIVTISSSSAQRGSPRMVHYAASKGGVIAMTKALAREYAPFGITVNNIPPSAIDTPMSRDAQASGNLPSNEVIAKTIPLGYLGTGDDIAAACAFLCSDEARYITGQVLGVNGGAVI
jgi:2-hydroxycyclohexanecarboxyl-CoA dehydrogenase